MKQLTLIMLLMAQLCLGQTPTVRVFDAQDAQEVTVEKEFILKNAVKWNWSLLPRGVFMLNYEREIKPWFSVEGGLGLCYRDFLFESTGIWTEEYSFGDNDAAYKIMPAFEGRIRFYPFQLDDMEGFYCSLGYLNRNYAYETIVNDQSYNSDYHISEKQFLIGWQYESFWLNNILADFYFGIGLRGFKGNMYKYDYDTNLYTKNKESSSNPAIYLGYKMTIPF